MTASAVHSSSSSSSSSNDDDVVVLELSHLAFVVVWWSMLLVHASIASLLFATNVLYAYMGDLRLLYYNKLLASDLAGQLAHVGWLFSVAGAVHCVELLKMLLCSLHARELSFRFQARTPKITPALPSSVIAVRAAGSATTDSRHASDTVVANATASPVRVGPTVADAEAKVQGDSTRLLGRLGKAVLRAAETVSRVAASIIPRRVTVALHHTLRALVRIRRALYDKRHGYLSVQSPHFHYLFLLRETIEIASQSYQMYHAATLLARPWVNAFFLSLVVINCWSTPLLQHALAHTSGLERVMCLTLDGLLDAGSAIVIPLIVFLPYVHAFDVATLAFPPDALYDPQWFVNMVREHRMLFAMSTADLVSKLVPHHSLYACMKNVKKFIVRRPNVQGLSSPAAAATPVSDANNGAVPARSDSRAAAVLNESASTKLTTKKKTKRPVEYPTRSKRLVHVVFTCWGIAVLAIYLHARQVSVTSDVSACKLKLRPWFATTFACASYTFDCYEQEHVGSLAPSDLAVLHTEYLAALVIANCPALVVPTEIQRFPNLLKLLVYNSSLVDWDASASINGRNHTSLVSISLVRVNMTEFPLGLQDALPDGLQDIQVSTSNVTALPRTLEHVWHPITIIYFERCDFIEFPLVLLTLRCDSLSLAGSRIAALPANTSSTSFSWVDLVLANDTELTALPASGFKSGLQTLSIENTGVTSMPSWVTSSTNIGPMGLSIYAYNTPYCIDKLAGASSSGTGSSDASSRTAGDITTVPSTTGGSGTGSGTGSSATTVTTSLSSGASLPGGTATVYCETRDPSGESRYPLTLTTAMFQPQ